MKLQSVELTRVMFHAIDHALFNCQSSNLYEHRIHIPNIFLKYKVGQKRNINADNVFPSPVLADAFSSPEFGLGFMCSLSFQRKQVHPVQAFTPDFEVEADLDPTPTASVFTEVR